MDSAAAIQPRDSLLFGPGAPDRVFAAADKTTVIRLRWPLVILCSYLLLYPSQPWLTESQTYALVFFYLATNAALYFVEDDRFECSYFYGPLLLFDTAAMAATVALSGGATTDFYVACFFTLVLSCICSDTRGLLVVTLLAPLLYAYVAFRTEAADQPSFYLRLSFPLVIALFYGYFAQVERLRRVVREKEEQAERERRAASEIRRQRDRLEVLHEINLAMTSTLDLRTALEALLEKTLAYLPYAAGAVRLRDNDTEAMWTAAARGLAAPGPEGADCEWSLLDAAAASRKVEVIRDLSAEHGEFLRRQGLAAMIALPLIADGEVLGSFGLFARQPVEISDEEVRFLLTLAGQAAVTVQRARWLQQIRRQADELRDANRVKDEFLGVVSHELKTPLNVISGYTNMLLEGILGEVTPIQEKALQTMLRQTKDLNATINSVLQVSCIEAEMVRAEIHDTNLWEFLYELKTYYDYPLAKDVQLVWDFRSDLPTLPTDRGKLKHVLQNLINNAIKFTDQGSVTVSARYLANKKTMEFKVADTGIGIPRELCPKIFERFRQGDSSDTRSYGGVGLGLYIVKKFVDLLGGTVHVASKPGEGSTFTVRIPCHRRAGAEQLLLSGARPEPEPAAKAALP
ncbi:MAG TPA: ATP-binding protein [candidate division Zixibacteria bacterium]|nr:ATP-binding protein [candidate division Zixibacteria bacterium]